MTRLPFIITHDGWSVRAFLVIDAGEPTLIEINKSQPTTAPIVALLELQERLNLLNDLMHAGVPFDALATCRRSPGLNGAILDPAAAELENLCQALKGKPDAA